MKSQLVRIVCLFTLLAGLLFAGEQAQAAVPGNILSIPAAAFLPLHDGLNYENHGQYLYHLDDSTVAAKFVAGVTLPHGALVTQVSFCFYDDSNSKSISAALIRRTYHGAGGEMAAGSSPSFASGFVTLNLSNITYPLVDNFNSIYYVEVMLPVTTQAAGDDLRLCGATIHYNRPAQQTGILAIPAVSLTPAVSGYAYGRSGGSLEDNNPLGGYYLGQVNLPDGAVVTKLTLRYKDVLDTNMAMVELIARDNASDGHTMASITSVDSTSEEQRSDTTIAAGYSLISNQANAYYVHLFLPKSSEIDGIDYIWISAILIEYDLPPWNRDGILHIPPAAFSSFHDGAGYDSGNWLFHLSSEGGGSAAEPYVAPVYLPQGARLTYATFKFYDGSNTQNGVAVLVRVKWGIPVTLAESTTSGAPGYTTSTVAVNPTYDTVDNSEYAYYVYYYLPVSTSGTPAAGDVVAVGVRVYYQAVTYNYLPSVRKAQ